jgi:UPF0716 family protein affecting phage T7 exclusion
VLKAILIAILTGISLVRLRPAHMLAIVITMSVIDVFFFVPPSSVLDCLLKFGLFLAVGEVSYFLGALLFVPADRRAFRYSLSSRRRDR